MKFSRYAVLPLALAALTACESEAERKADAAEDRVEQQAKQSAATAGDVVAALGLSERQLLDADLVSATGLELGSIEQVRRDNAGAVTGFLVEIEDSNPDRFVVVPLSGLTVRTTGNDRDLQTTMTAQDLAKLPSVTL